MNNIKTIDLNFQKNKDAIATYLIESSEGPILIETGPESTYENLNNEIKKYGYKAEDVQHVFLTHIHFDHAGAAWKFAKNGAKIYVHPIGLPHLANPEKLWNSAAQIYKDDMDRLWGKMEPIAEEQLIAVNDGDEITLGDVNLKIWYTPGHAVHHNAIQYNNVIFTGDVGGIKIDKGPVMPPCPPPDINIELWKQSIQKLRDLNPDTLYLTHYGKADNPQQLFNELEDMLDKISSWIKPHYDNNTPVDEITPEFMDYSHKFLIEKGLNKGAIQTYEYANPSWMSVTGLLRYWKLKEQGRI